MKPIRLLLILTLLINTSYQPIHKYASASGELTATFIDAEGENWGGANSNNKTYFAELLRGEDVIDEAEVGSDGSVRLVDETIGIEETQGEEIIQNAYPNPFGSVLAIPVNNSEAIENIRTEVYDMKGSLVDVIEKEMNSQTGTMTWNATEKPTGAYILQSTITERDGDKKQNTAKAIRVQGGPNAQVNNWNTTTKDSKLEYTLRVSGPNMQTTNYLVDLYEGEITQLGDVIAQEQPVNVGITGNVVNQNSEAVEGNAYLIREGDTLQTMALEDGSYELEAEIGGNDYNQSTMYDVVVNGETFEEERAENVTITGDTTTIDFNVEEEQPPEPITLTGFVYDLDNKYDENWERVQPPGLENMIVYLQSEGIENHVRTDSEGRFSMTRSQDDMSGWVEDTITPDPQAPEILDFWTRVKDTLVVAGTETDLSDTTYYFFKTPVNKLVIRRQHVGDTTYLFDSTYVNEINAGEINEITAFNDTTGMPMIQQEYFEETNRDLIGYMQYVTRIAEKRTHDPIWEHTTTRVRDEDLPIKVYRNTEEDPTGGEYSQDLYEGKEFGQAGRFRVTTTTHPDSAFLHCRYDNPSIAQGYSSNAEDELGTYYDHWEISYNQNGLGENLSHHTGAHEISHLVFAGGNTTYEILDQYYKDVVVRAGSGVPIESPPSEHRAKIVIYNLERNPKLYQYTKTLPEVQRQQKDYEKNTSTSDGVEIKYN